MSLNKTFYEAYKALSMCNLVTKTSCTDVDMKEFETLLNNAQPSHDSPLYGQYELARAMYRSNPHRYVSYITRPANNVSALILWTESKHIVDYFGLRSVIYLTWNRTDNRYVVLPYNRQLNPNSSEHKTDSQESRHRQVRTRRVYPRTSQSHEEAPARITQRRGAIFRNDSHRSTESVSDHVITSIETTQPKQWSDMQ